MPISVTGTRSNSRGLSLIEMLAVIMILALVGSVVVLSIPSGREKGEKLALSLTAKLDAAKDIAVMSGSMIGFTVEDGQGQFSRYTETGWVDMADSKHPLKPISFPSGTKIEISVTGEVLQGTVGEVVASTTLNEKAPVGPNLIFAPTGEVQNFEILITSTNRHWKILANDSGKITMVRE